MDDDSNQMSPPKVDTIFTHAQEVTCRLLVEGMEVATASGPTPGMAFVRARALLSPTDQRLFP